MFFLRRIYSVLSECVEREKHFLFFFVGKGGFLQKSASNITVRKSIKAKMKVFFATKFG